MTKFLRSSATTVVTILSSITPFGADAIHPVEGLLERVETGASSRFSIKETGGEQDYFEISTSDGKPQISGNNAVNIAAGLNWYLKYYAGTHISWNSPQAILPEVLPLPNEPERHDSDAPMRYYLNYCTHSYSMAFWDWERWEQEIDWMALHGINMPLAMTGVDVVWRNTLQRLGYSQKETDAFIAGPAFQAWWLMNNLEGWGGPNSPQWYADREELQKKILSRMKEYGMHPVLPGFSGMLPHDAGERLGVSVSGAGKWNGFIRPVILSASDPRYNEIADIYYDELTRLYGKADYYSMDPFHESGGVKDIDFKGGGKVISDAMQRANPDAVWVIQGWQENPRQELLAGVEPGRIVVLDLASEIKSHWGDPDSPAPIKRPEGYDAHDWLYCMLLNFGGNVGLHGRMDYVIDGYYKARDTKFSTTLRGIGLTMEGIENNPVMYELLSELIWRPEKFSKEEWLKGYVKARYGVFDNDIYEAWLKLSSTIYNCPKGNLQQGTTESIFCARPAREVWQVSSWSRMKKYYEPEDVIEAAAVFAKAAEKMRGNGNYEYDLVDITRQATAERGRLLHKEMTEALKASDLNTFEKTSSRFLELIKAQDRLLSTRSEFGVGKWIEDARALAPSDSERDRFEWNARLLISTWGLREASEQGGLRDYAHREWAGVLSDLYHTRWSKLIEREKDILKGANPEEIDFYAIDEQWVNSCGGYSSATRGDAVDVALEVGKLIFR